MTRPEYPGPAPWWPNTLVLLVPCYGGGILFALAFGYPWAFGLNIGVLLLLALMMVFRWRFRRWSRRMQAWFEHMERTGERIAEL